MGLNPVDQNASSCCRHGSHNGKDRMVLETPSKTASSEGVARKLVICRSSC